MSQKSNKSYTRAKIFWPHPLGVGDEIAYRAQRQQLREKPWACPNLGETHLISGLSPMTAKSGQTRKTAANSIRQSAQILTLNA